MHCSACTTVLTAIQLKNLYYVLSIYCKENKMAEDEIVAEENFSEDIDASKWQVFVNDMSWSSKQIRPLKRTKELPTQLTYDVPENVII